MSDYRSQEDARTIERLAQQLDHVGTIVRNIRIIVGALVAVVVVAFGAGVYFANALAAATKVADNVRVLETRLVAAESNIAAQKAVDAKTRELMAANFSNFAANMVPVGEPLPSTEPLVSGGGTKPMCAPGTVVIGLQLYKDDNGQRTVRIQCGKFGDVKVD